MSKRRSAVESQQFEYRVRKSVDCIVVVEACTQQDADKAVKDASNWIDEQDVECCDWEVCGRA